MSILADLASNAADKLDEKITEESLGKALEKARENARSAFAVDEDDDEDDQAADRLALESSLGGLRLIENHGAAVVGMTRRVAAAGLGLLAGGDAEGALSLVEANGMTFAERRAARKGRQAADHALGDELVQRKEAWEKFAKEAATYALSKGLPLVLATL